MLTVVERHFQQVMVQRHNGVFAAFNRLAIYPCQCVWEYLSLCPVGPSRAAV